MQATLGWEAVGSGRYTNMKRTFSKSIQTPYLSAATNTPRNPQTRKLCIKHLQSSSSLSAIERSRAALNGIQQLSPQIGRRISTGALGTTSGSSKATLSRNTSPNERTYVDSTDGFNAHATSLRQSELESSSDIGDFESHETFGTPVPGASAQTFARSKPSKDENSDANALALPFLRQPAEVSHYDGHCKLEAINENELSESGPALPSGTMGALVTTKQRLQAVGSPVHSTSEVRAYLLAQRLIRGELVNFNTEEESITTLSIVKDITRHASANRSEKGATANFEEPKFSAFPKAPRDMWENKHLRGMYQSPHQRDSTGATRNIIHLIRKNESFTGKDEAALLRKVGSLYRAATERPRSRVHDKLAKSKGKE